MAKRHVKLSRRARSYWLRYISELIEQNPAAAEKLALRFESLREKLTDFPNIAQRGSIPDTRRVVMRPLILTIRVSGNLVEVILIRHERQAETDLL